MKRKAKEKRIAEPQIGVDVLARIKRSPERDALLNQFAGDALRGLLSEKSANICDRETICRTAWKYAHEMLRQKEIAE